MLVFENPICFFDLETTGTSTKDDRIVEIAIVKLLPDGSKLVYASLLDPEIQIPQGAVDVHGISNEIVKDCLRFKDIAPNIIDFIKGSDLAGFNVIRFDIPLLFKEFKRAGIKWDWRQHNFIDIGNIFKIKEERTLSAAHQFYLNKEIAGAHGALADVEACMNVFEAQLAKYDDLPGTVDELALASNFNRKIVDLSGNFGLDDNGEIIFKRGKHEGKKAKDEKNYLQWMLRADFDDDTKEIARALVYGGERNLFNTKN